MNEIQCVHCNITKPLKYFHRDRSNGETGYSRYCIPCKIEQFHHVEPSGKRRRSTIVRLMPVLRRMQHDSRSSVQEWLDELIEVLPIELRKEFGP